ncbi:MAG: hypothetical protein M3Q81_00575 [bacterium]|nr:hypothetical protein [bacterium]
MNDTSPTNPFLDLDNARVDEQRQVMQEIAVQGICPFCIENLEKNNPRPWLKEGEYWLVIPNRWPYENTQHQLLFILKKHAESLVEIEPAAGEELVQLLAELESEMKLPGGGFSMRFGDTNYSAGSVKHIHGQLIVPDITKVGFQPVRVKLGKDQLKPLQST